MMAQIQPIKQAMAMVKTASNPQAAMEQMLSNNPNYQQINKLIQDNGGDAQKAFYSMAEQMGINPDDVLSMLK